MPRASADCENASAAATRHVTVDLTATDPPRARCEFPPPALSPRCGENPAEVAEIGSPAGRIYLELCSGVLRFGPFRPRDRPPAMSISTTHTAERANPLRAPLAFWVGVGIYA